MASYGAPENDWRAVRTTSPPRPALLVRAKSAVFHAATSRCVITPGSIEEDEEERRRRQQQRLRPQSASVSAGSRPSLQPQTRFQHRIKPRPYSKASSPVLQRPQAVPGLLPRQLQPRVSVYRLASGKTPPPRACLYVPPATPTCQPRPTRQRTWSTGARPSSGSANPPLDATYGGSYDHCRSGFTKNCKFNRNFSSTQSELTSQTSPSLKIRSLRVGQPGGGGLLGKRSLPRQVGVSLTSAVSTVNSYPTCPSPPKTPSPNLSPSETSPSSGGAMPTNQSSPWSNGKLRAASKADSPSATSITTPTRATASTQVPSSWRTQETCRSKDLAKPFSSNNGSSSQETAAPPVAKVTEQGNGNDTDATQSRLTPTPRSDGGGKAVGKREKGQPMDDCLSPHAPTKDLEKEHDVGADVQSGKGSPLLRSSQPHNGTVIDGPQGVGVLLLGLGSEPPGSGFPTDRITNGPAALPHTAKSTPEAKLHSLPVSPSLCRAACDHQGAWVGEEATEAGHASILDGRRTEIRTAPSEISTTKVNDASAKSRSTSTTASQSPSVAPVHQPGSSPTTPGSSPTTPGSSPNTPGSSPTTPSPTTPGSSPTTPSPTTPGSSPTTPSPTTPGSSPTTPGSSPTTPGSSPTTPGSSPTTPGSSPTTPGSSPTTPGSSPTTPGSSPTTPGSSPNTPSACASATQEKQPTKTDSVHDVTSSPAGASLHSVTNQISAIQLTKRGQLPSTSSSPSSSSPSSSSPSLSKEKEHLVVETQLSCPDSAAMQVDGEEEFPDEMEKFLSCSDDDASDCSSIDDASSTTSITFLSGVEEPMSSEVEDDREERPALVTSLFPLFPPTLYFSTANERVELLPPEQRRLLKWKMSSVTPNVVKHTIDRSHFKTTKRNHDWLGCWGHHMKSPGFKAIREYQKLNHFPGSFQIGRKDRLWRNLSKMQARFGKREFSFFPRSFILPQDIKRLRKAWEDGGSRKKWIIKPPASARGIGIQVIHKWSQMPRKRPLLVQKYLHKPYLISGNKFDLRIYVYVTSYDPLRVYIFSDGLVRFASCKYSSSMKSLSNKFMHLTNYSVNKKNSEYQSNSDDKACQGHKWALKALWFYLGSKGINTTLIWEKIKDIVIKTIIASDPYVNTLLKSNVRSAYSCHELFGFDIMLDENLKPWVLEVNISPSLHSNTALDVSIKGQMIRDLLNLAGFLLPRREEVVAAAASCSSTTSSTSSLCGGGRDRTSSDLSTDEKVKRAFYLTQRFTDQDFLPTVLDVLTPEDVRVLAESEDELSRRGEFERVFPSPSSSRYLHFFECPRYLNILLDQWEQKHWNNRAKGISLLRSICQRGVHLGTTDPAHMWSKCSYISRFEPHKRDDLRSSSVVVSHRRRSHAEDHDGSDRDVRSLSSSMPSVSLPASPSPGSSTTTSPCPSPQPGLTQNLLPGQSV